MGSGGGFGFVCRIVRQAEGNEAEAAKDGAKEASGVALGDAAGAVVEESVEDVEGFGGEFLGLEGDEVAFEVAPVAEGSAGAGVLGLEGARAGQMGLGRMLTAEDMAGRGTAAATFPVGEGETAFHWGFLQQ